LHFSKRSSWTRAHATPGIFDGFSTFFFNSIRCGRAPTQGLSLLLASLHSSGSEAFVLNEHEMQGLLVCAHNPKSRKFGSIYGEVGEYWRQACTGSGVRRVGRGDVAHIRGESNGNACWVVRGLYRTMGRCLSGLKELGSGRAGEDKSHFSSENLLRSTPSSGAVNKSMSCPISARYVVCIRK
jgi:hypothetical protein